MPNLIGQSLGRYHITEEIGKGGMAVVYKAHDTHLETVVAVKVIRTELLASGILDRALKRFEREAKALAKLTHANIVKVLDYGTYKGKPYLVMPYLPGGTLKQRLIGRPLPWKEAVRLIFPVARALAYAHSEGMIHRDVKPSNILITRSGDPMLTDFGIAKIIDEESASDLTGTSTMMGTPEYMAPEQVVSKNVDFRADIYTLGVVFYEMVTGRKPFVADTPMAVLFKHARDPLPRPSSIVPTLPDAVESLLIKALAKKPEDRYPDMAAMAAALEVLLESKLEISDVKSRRPKGSEKEVKRTEILDDQGTVEQQDTHATRLQAETRNDYSTKKQDIDAGPAYSGKLSGTHHRLLANGKRAWVPWMVGISGLGILALLITLFFLLGKNPNENGVASIDGMHLVSIPAGEFIMGSDEGDRDAMPVHEVYLDAFQMDATEVTNAMFRKFIEANNYRTDAETRGWSFVYDLSSSEWQETEGANWQHPQGPQSPLLNMDDHPVVHVSWNDALAYCTWAGRRLPTEAEWEKAARGTDGNSYPWGNVFDGAKVNFCDGNCGFPWADQSIDDGFGNTSPVGNYRAGASRYGAFDMAGNVWEWVADWYGDGYYYQSPANNPGGPTTGMYHVLRGGSWYNDSYTIRSSVRAKLTPSNSNNITGFRCAISAVAP